MFSRVAGLVKIVRTAVEKRHRYASTGDVLLSMLYGFALTRIGTRLVGERKVHLGLRGLRRRVRLRTSTADFWVIRDIFEDGAYESLPQLLLPARALVLDLGAHIGLATLFIAATFDDPFVISVEPDPDNYRLLQENCSELEARGRVVTVHGFVGPSDGFAGIDRSLGTWGYRKASAVPDQETIPCHSVLTLLERFTLSEIDLLKCDIEGTEVELFGHCAAWIGRVRRMMVEIHGSYGPTELYADLRRSGWPFEVVFEQRVGFNHVCMLSRTDASPSPPPFEPQSRLSTAN